MVDCEIYEEKTTLKLPVPLGTPVYVIEKCRCLNEGMDPAGCYTNERQLAKTKYIYAAKAKAKRGSSCFKVYKRPLAIEHLAKIGKTVFVTLDEAKKKIAEKTE